MLVAILVLAASFAVVTAGATLLVRGASAAARALGVSSFFIGLTIVGFGTSMPEFFASLIPAIHGHGDLAVGNVVGSNIFNIAFILGLAALLCPIPVSLRIVRREVLLVVAVSFVPFAALLTGGKLERWIGILMAAGIVLYLWRGYVAARREGMAEAERTERELEEDLGLARRAWHTTLAASLGFVAAGLALLVGGSNMLVASATHIARELGISELVIGLTIVAAGTSMPELATSVVAAARRQPDISVGNILGSNIFNILAILGTTTAVRPQTLQAQTFCLDLPVMLAASLALLPIVTNDARISRLEGGLLLAGYVAYLGALTVIGAAP